jgi:hypothetical protein
MPIGPDERYDFFLSRRGSVAAIAQEVADAIGGRAIPLDSERSRRFLWPQWLLHCLPALNGATCALGNFPECLTGRTSHARPRR